MNSLRTEKLEELLQDVAMHSKLAVSALTGMTEGAVKTLIECFDVMAIKACVDAIKENAEILAYQSFDPAVTFKILLEKHEKVVSKPGYVDLGFDHTSFNNVMSYCISIFLTRSTNWLNIKKKSLPALEKIMDHLASTYAIGTFSPKEKAVPEPKVITLSRIAASLSHITITLFDAGIGRTLLPEDKYQVGVFPRVLLCPNVSSLLYSESQSDSCGWAPHNLMLWINYLNDKVLHSKDSKYTIPRELV